MENEKGTKPTTKKSSLAPGYYKVKLKKGMGRITKSEERVYQHSTAEILRDKFKADVEGPIENYVPIGARK